MLVMKQPHLRRPQKLSPLLVLVLSSYFCAPGFADDEGSFFNFKNSDFFEVALPKEDEKRKEREEREEEEEREERKVDKQDWQNRPDNPAEDWRESFIDASYGRNDFRNLQAGNSLSKMFDLRGYRKQDFSPDRGSSDDSSRSDAYDLNSDDASDAKMERDRYRRRMKEDDKRMRHELDKPIDGLLHDWVPSPPDKTNNGGFTSPPDNGYVVPYKLNGWIEIERKLPWEAEH
jgi:hypothetical protein